MTSRGGGLVISLDLEMHWGVRDWCGPGNPYMENLLAERGIVAEILRCFEVRKISATWAIVGLLFASSREEAERFFPSERPWYSDPALYPYDEAIGATEQRDPIHLAGSVIDHIRQTAGQQIGSHTFSHYYCQEPGQTLATFRADTESAMAIARSRGVRLRSMAFPKNQVNKAYLPSLLDFGIGCYRGNNRHWAYRGAGRKQSRSPARRGLRLLDSYMRVDGHSTQRWDQILDPLGLCNVAAGIYLRPHEIGAAKALGTTRLRRICGAMDYAAVNEEVLHLWWHPHNFASDLAANMSMLDRLLDRFDENRDRFNFRSMTMEEAAFTARSLSS